MINKILMPLLLAISTLIVLLVPVYSLAAAPVDTKIHIGVYQPKENAGVQVFEINTGPLVGRIVKNTIGLLYTVGGVGFVIYFIWGIVEWILSGGDKEKVANARKRITTAIIGIVLLSLSFAIIGIVGQIVGIDFFGNFGIPSFTQQ